MINQLRNNVLNGINKDEIVALAKDLVRIPSFASEESEATRFLSEFMEKQGLNVEIQEVEEGRFQSIGWLEGDGEGPSLAFNGHIDISPLTLGYTRDPFTPYIENEKLYGHGIANMKAGVTANIMAATAVKRAGVELKGDLIVENVIGEHQGGIGTYHTIKKGIIPDYAIVTEPTNLYIRTKQAGVAEFLINIYGVSRWIGAMDQPHPHLGKAINAVEKMCKVISTLKKVKFTFDPQKVHVPGLPKINIGGILGGQGSRYDLTRPSWSPDICTIAIDVRFVPGMTVESIKNDLHRSMEMLKNEDPNLRYEIETPPGTYKAPWNFCKLVHPPLNLSIDEYIVDVVKTNHRFVTSKEVKKTGVIIEDRYYSSYAGADTGHLWNAGVKAIAYGPGWSDGSPPDANVSIENIVICTKVLALTALDICSKSKSEGGNA